MHGLDLLFETKDYVFGGAMRYFERLARYLNVFREYLDPKFPNSSDSSIRDNQGSAPRKLKQNAENSDSNTPDVHGRSNLSRSADRATPNRPASDGGIRTTSSNTGKEDDQAFALTQLASARHELDCQALEIRQKSVDIDRLENRLKDERSAAKSLKNELEEAARKVAPLKKEIRALKRQLSKAVESELALQSELNRLQQRTRRQKREIEALKKVGAISDREGELSKKQQDADVSRLAQSTANQPTTRVQKLPRKKGDQDDATASLSEHCELVAFNLLKQGKERGFVHLSQIRPLIDTSSERDINGDAIVEFFHRNGIDVYESPQGEENSSVPLSRRTSSAQAEVFASKMHEALLGILHSSTDIPEANPSGAVHMLQELGEYEIAQRVRTVTDNASLNR